jgi:UDP-2,3-diacylglucosamine hydrolase
VTTKCLLISDLHLNHPEEKAAIWLQEELQRVYEQRAQLFILGDLFEAWIGDDAATPVGQWLQQQLGVLASADIPMYFLHGNRDFLVGTQFLESCGVQLLTGPTVVNMQQGPTLLLHGDELCTDDVAYQQFRQQVRNPLWQQQFLSQPISERIRQAQEARAASKEHTSQAAESIMDVNEQAVVAMFEQYQVQHMIHGHTHRPNLHRYGAPDGSQDHEKTRLVLGDWYRAAAPHWLDERIEVPTAKN